MVANETGGTETPASTKDRRTFPHNQDPKRAFALAQQVGGNADEAAF
jgi:hypothetical protein